MKESVLLHPALIDQLVNLARRLHTLRRPAEAAELLEISAALSPQGASLREEAHRLRGEEGIEDFDREFKRRNLEASHALGMAHIFETRGEFNRAVEMIDLAKMRTPFNYLAFAAAGYLHMRHANATAALTEFIQARRLNPLDFRLAVETSRAALENESFETALENAIDAMLLASWRSERELEQERRRVDTLARLCHRGEEEMDTLIRARTSALQKASDHVALSQARIFTGSGLPAHEATRARTSDVQDNLLQRATELRQVRMFRHLKDDQLIDIAKILEPLPFQHGNRIFREGEQGRDLYLVREGTVHITRTTAAGTQILTTLGIGSLFGEVSYVDGLERSATAYGVGSGTVYRIPAASLEEQEARDRDLAVSMLWTFWQTLADKVRAANAQMSELFSLPSPDQTVASADPGRNVSGPCDEPSFDILRDQGLSAQELRLLAKYSQEVHFPPNGLIFAEGERDDSLYIVVDGSIRISRLVPGMGEECLSILERGEVFGEMALIDDHPRSADARAHIHGSSVFSISRELLEEVLSMDPDAAVQFLTLLCRLLCRRLRAMNDRLVAWRILVSHESPPATQK
jgi:CRP/FNR family cyclic AMP-dependent transcriptional regulator